MKSKMIDSEFMLSKPRLSNTSLFECQTPSKSICSIRSVKHANEHLFGSSNDYDKLYNHLFDMIQIRKVFMSSLKYLKSTSTKAYLQLLWDIEPVNGMKETFYIKSMLFKNERLCASHKQANLLNLKRKVNLVKYTAKDKLTNSKCMWKITATDESNCNYLISNLFYKEFLFSGTDFFKSGSLKYRNVYTLKSSKKSEYVDENNQWNFDCKSIA